MVVGLMSSPCISNAPCNAANQPKHQLAQLVLCRTRLSLNTLKTSPDNVTVMMVLIVYCIKTGEEVVYAKKAKPV